MVHTSVYEGEKNHSTISLAALGRPSTEIRTRSNENHGDVLPCCTMHAKHHAQRLTMQIHEPFVIAEPCMSDTANKLVSGATAVDDAHEA